ncbi:MAG: DNA-processing protein DprA [Ancalomicrobiaceae bacterium]|nr:DNA-processing protein DprA [Ancalomicrobiaceae bacterium]
MSEDRPRPGLPGVTLSDAQRRAWLRLIRSENVGPVTFRALVNHFGSADKALEALPDLARRGGASGRIRIAGAAEIDRELEAAHRLGARFVALGEPGYPRYLRAIEGPPPLLAVKGGTGRLGVGTQPPGLFDPGLFDRPTVAIVGARNASITGRKFAGTLARSIGEAGYAVVSGLARGIDAAAHEASTRTGTVGVMAGGLDRLYPPEHADLVAAIIEDGGAVVSEMPFGWEPRARDFPRRNRLISGMALGVVVVEAAARSGSLHTARFAAEQGRDVFAVPGSPLDPRAEGCNDLIRSGATLIASPDHLIEALKPMADWDPPESSASEPTYEPDDDGSSGRDMDRARSLVVEALGYTPTPVDDVIRATSLHPAVVHLILLELDLAGRLERHGSGMVGLIG